MKKDLYNYSVKELKQMIKKKITGYSRLKKDELITLLQSNKKFLRDNKISVIQNKCDGKKCSSDKICNPVSGRCVTKTGKIGRKLLLTYSPDIAKPLKPKPYIKCPSGKILNPKTNRCVNKNGKIGQTLLKKLDNKSSQDKTYSFEKFKNALWFIFYKKGCTYCDNAKDILSQRNIKYQSFEITDQNKNKVWSKTDPITNNYHYYPMIFNNGNFIGGYSELKKMITDMPLVSNIHLMEPILVTKTNFHGSPWYEMVAMIYLLYKYPKDCVAIPHGLLAGKNKLTTKAQQVKHFSQTSLDWSEIKMEFTVPSGLWTAVKSCLKKDVNFIVLPMGFTCKNGMGHANFLIYDSNTKEMERFEPNGVMSQPCYNPPQLEKKIKSIFNKNVKNDMITKVYDPLSFCPPVNFQKIQHWEKQKKPTDPKGFCAAWSAWYADTRLANPRKTRKQVVDLALEKLEKNPQSFTDFIRSYAGFLEKAGKELKKSKDPFKVFSKMIQKYT